VITQNY